MKTQHGSGKISQGLIPRRAIGKQWLLKERESDFSRDKLPDVLSSLNLSLSKYA